MKNKVFEDSTATDIVFFVIGLLLMIPIAIVFNGWTLTILWDWFVIPVFHVQTLRIPYAIGLMTCLGFVTTSLAKRDFEKDMEKIETMSALWGKIAAIMFGPAFAALIMGWIVTKFI